MHDKVKEFIDRKNKENLKRQKERQRQHLIDLGLFEKEYAEGGTRSSKYPIWDQKRNEYCRLVPIEVTDEEYAAICSVDEGVESVRPSENLIVKVLKVVGWIAVIGGFVAGLVLGYDRYDEEFVWGVVIVQWFGSIVRGIVFFGLAEVIKLLQAILNKQR